MKYETIRKRKQQKKTGSIHDNDLVDILSRLEKKIKSGEHKIAVYGLGHVGSPLTAAWLRSKAHVIGVDNSIDVLKLASKGKTHIPEPGVSEAFSEGIRSKRFFLSNNLVQASKDSFLKMICVPVLAEDGSANLSNVKNVTTEIGKGLKKYDIVSLNPSVPPGTTEKIVIPLLQKTSGLEAEKDFFMIYNPERIYEGRAIEDIEERYHGIVSGYGERSLEIGSRLLAFIYKKGIISMSNIKSAEAEKLFEGVYRDVNIALANELAIFSEKIGIDFWEARSAANSQPFCHIHKPGIGVGGACIPVYPQFIMDTAKNVGINCKITKSARLLNNSMPNYCVNQALKLVNSRYDTLTITLLGLAFRGGVSDTRLSPTYDVIRELQKVNVKKINVHDPLVKIDLTLNKYKNVFLLDRLSQALKKTDLIIIITDHEQYKKINHKSIKNIPLYDGRGIFNKDDLMGMHSTIGITK